MKAIFFVLLVAQALPALAGGSPAPRNYFLEYYIFQILGLMAVLTLASELAGRRGVSPRRLRLGWNWVLLLGFAACVLSGFALFLPLQKPLARLLFKVHVWTGAACGWAGLYHAAQRMRALLPRGGAA